jgi:hypothetical protein
MAGLTDAVEQDVLNGLFQDPQWAGYPSLWLALSSTTPTDAGGNFTEPSGGGYARVETAAADWDPATGTAPATKSNSGTLSFPQATADWVAGADLTHAGLFDAATVGNLVAFGALDTAKPVLDTDTASFAAGELTMQLGDPADSF